MKTHAIAPLSDFHDPHQVMRQNLLNNLRHAYKHLSDIQNVGQRVEKAVEDFKPGGNISLLRWPIGRMRS
jgi:hypothetical protein